jgi:membrane-bound lytic murein transglycosylase B
MRRFFQSFGGFPGAFHGPRARLARAFVTLLLAVVAVCATAGPSAAKHHRIKIPVPIAKPDPDDIKFAQFVHDFRDTALATGITADTYDKAMSGIVRNPRVQQLNQEQPEFTRPVWDYLDGAVSPWRISKGQEMEASYGTMLANIEQHYGVPKEILVAIWGVESAYGTAMGGFNMFEALTTLAYDGPRQDYARKELLAALKMMQQEKYDPTQMTSSWAGAFGNTQFVPSSFLDHAVDGDGDGKRDLWHSPADALASSAKLLSEAGWKRGADWGYEIKLPDGFAYESADVDLQKPLSEWKKLGLKTIFGADLPDSADAASIYLPAGARGPAFLVLDNFRTVLKYNNAASYALAVCYLANRLRGSAEIATAWPRYEQPLSRDERFAFQTDLKKLGYDPGVIDGVIGHGVRAAARKYQKDHALAADGFVTQDLLTRMDAEVKAKGL